MIVYFYIGLLMTVLYSIIMSRYRVNWRLLEAEPAYFQEAITLIVAFRNEEDELPALLQSLKQLDYPADLLKVIFVNDHSNDNGRAIIEASGLRYSVSILDLNEGQGKKDALKLAWGEVKTNLVIQTDADCTVPEHWLKAMLAPFSDPNVKFVSGPVGYKENKGFWRRLLSMDFSSLVAIGGAHINAKRPLICNGANLAFRTEILEDVDLLDHRASGDDVFLMQSVHQKHKDSVAFAKSENAMVLTKGPEDFGAFLNQRLRWASKNGEYKNLRNVMNLVTVWLFNVVMLVNLLSLNKILFHSFLFMLVVKYIFELEFYYGIKQFFRLERVVSTLFLGQIFHIIYMALLPIISRFVSYKWKGRSLR